MAPLTRLERRRQQAAADLLGIQLRGGRTVPRAAPVIVRRPPRAAQVQPAFSQQDDEEFQLPADYLERQRDRLNRLTFGGARDEVVAAQFDNLLGNDLEDYNAPDMVGADGEMQNIGNAPGAGFDIATSITNDVVEGDVPILNISVDISVIDEGRYPSDGETIKTMFQFALQAALVAAQQRMPGINIYAQVRLSADGNQQMRYDITTPMVLATELEAVFNQTLDDALQSNPNIGTDVSDLRFRFTLVAPDGNITPGLVNRTNREFAASASNARQRRASAVQARERFVRLNEWRENRLQRIAARSRTQTRGALRRIRQNVGARRIQGTVRRFLERRAEQRFERALEAARQARPEGQRVAQKEPRGFPNMRFAAKQPRQIRNVEGSRPSAARITFDETPPEEYGAPAMIPARKRKARTEAQKKAYAENQKRARRAAKLAREVALGQAMIAGPDSQLSLPDSFDLGFRGSFDDVRGGGRGMYDNMKRKIFHHTALDEFFLHSKAVLEVPNTHEEGYCLAMAFIRSQARFYDLKTGDVREALVSHDISEDDMNDPHCLLVSLPILPPYEQYLCGPSRYSFLKYDKTSKETEGVLFNPYRSRRANEQDPLARGGMKYQNVLEKDEIQAWYRLAQNFHEYVTCVINESFPEIVVLDPNKEDTLQYYADVTQTVICVYRLQLQGKRTRVFIPFNFPRDIRQQEGIRVVSILINDNHATAITNLRDFVQNKATANRTTVNSYCLCCEKITTANNETKQASKNHFLKCLESNQGELKTSHKSALRRQQVASYSAPQFIFNTKSRQYTCRTCNQVRASALRPACTSCTN